MDVPLDFGCNRSNFYPVIKLKVMDKSIGSKVVWMRHYLCHHYTHNAKNWKCNHFQHLNNDFIVVTNVNYRGGSNLWFNGHSVISNTPSPAGLLNQSFIVLFKILMMCQWIYMLCVSWMCRKERKRWHEKMETGEIARRGRVL